MNLNQLYYFKKLSEIQHFTQAAKELYITQPSLSEAISSLEEEIGLELFHRQGRKIKLTKYGKVFYHYVCNSLSELEKGIECLKESSGIVGGIIDIGCIPTLCGNFLPNIINKYLNTVNSKTKFNIFTGMTLDVIAGIKSEKYDIGFCSILENEPSIEFIPILDQELVLVVNDKHPLAKEKIINLQDISDYPLITYRQSLPIGKTIMELLKPYDLHVSYDFDDEITIGGMVCSTNVAAITARTSFLLQFHKLKIIKLNTPNNTRTVYMAYNKNNYHSIAVKMFSDYMIKKSKSHKIRTAN
ncbi:MULTISPECIES: LysR family transcriptional regulator [Clostridium]|uniref:Transcriptional regulator n=4 Tax=Clostridium TaxID=1485 RepID=D8GUT4_CLOLD|nr:MULTISPECIES: LysR family transcriptional regulator [Clostridium]ADK16961.1 transcriptional regulator [Clostridium ljungdahlii DSM 13528]AGY76001.1 LysR family transcriptional regulator [Clostridium autoethanogenum DSM 10061]ALU36164.1 Transcriptional regulator LysR family [Clostridium autoethanogenum DSM 10061]OAA85338.1 HTH-type transcriptional regulator CynR [Clostridium ljungdahlii DSM 13528]OVY51778.1 HTH-type transcriptional regulator CynR [Clostridium autoethanogenum]